MRTLSSTVSKSSVGDARNVNRGVGSLEYVCAAEPGLATHISVATV